MLSKEIVDIITKINQEIHNLGDYEGYDFLEYRTNGYGEAVTIFNILAWSSEADERRYIDEDEEEYEPLEFFLRRRVNELATMISEVKVEEVITPFSTEF